MYYLVMVNRFILFHGRVIPDRKSALALAGSMSRWLPALLRILRKPLKEGLFWFQLISIQLLSCRGIWVPPERESQPVIHFYIDKAHIYFYRFDRFQDNL